MFLRDTTEERDRVEKSWGPLKLPIVCVLCPPEITFQQLGAEALKTTQSTKVVCLGGGAVVDEEIELGSTDVSYYYFGARRRSASDPDVYDRSALAPRVMQVRSDRSSRGSVVVRGQLWGLTRQSSM